MGLLTNCPEAAFIQSIVEACQESFGQIQKVIIQRIYSSPGTKNAVANPALLASWTPLLAALDSTKVTTSPYIQAPNTEPGAARTYGGGNETLGGIEIIVGSEPTAFTGNILQTKQSVIKAMKSFMTENIGVWLIDEYGRIGCIVDDPETPTQYYAIPARAFFVGDKTFGGLESPDMNGIQWKFLPNWSDNFAIVTPVDFNPLSDLVNP